jgi:hypothetical protein
MVQAADSLSEIFASLEVPVDDIPTSFPSSLERRPFADAAMAVRFILAGKSTVTFVGSALWPRTGTRVRSIRTGSLSPCSMAPGLRMGS